VTRFRGLNKEKLRLYLKKDQRAPQLGTRMYMRRTSSRSTRLDLCNYVKNHARWKCQFVAFPSWRRKYHHRYRLLKV